MCTGHRYCRGPGRKHEGFPTAQDMIILPSPCPAPGTVLGNVLPPLPLPPCTSVATPLSTHQRLHPSWKQPLC